MENISVEIGVAVVAVLTSLAGWYFFTKDDWGKH